MGNDHILKVTTDKSVAYKNTLTNIMGGIHYAYPQIVKRRLERLKVFVKGREKISQTNLRIHHLLR